MEILTIIIIPLALFALFAIFMAICDKYDKEPRKILSYIFDILTGLRIKLYSTQHNAKENK